MKAFIGTAYVESVSLPSSVFGFYINRDDFSEPVRSMGDVFPSPEDAIDAAQRVLEWMEARP